MGRLKMLAALVVVLVAGVFIFLQLHSSPWDDHVCRYNRSLALEHPLMRGHDVWELQQRLRTLGYYAGPLHGIYDEDTARAVREVQRDLGLEPDGVAELWLWPMLYHGEEYTQGVNTEPPPGEVHIEVYLHKLKLTVFSDGEEWASFPICSGNPATPSPMGEWRIVNKSYRPNDAFGTRWMRLSVPWGGYGIHGTNAPHSIGTWASLGCIRMYNRDVELIYPWIPIGTRAIVYGNYNVRIRVPMGPGQVGQDVVLVQWAMREAGFCPGEANGTFNPDTEAALIALQKLMGLEPTGVLDQQIYLLLNLP